MQIPAEMEQDLNDWYRQEHLPERAGIPGFQSALRYRSLNGEPKYMALYDLDSPQVLYSDAYKALRGNATDWTRRIGRALEKNIRHEYELIASAGEGGAEPAPYVVLVRFGAGEDVEKLLAARILPAYAATPGVRRARAYRAVVGLPAYLTYYELEDGDVVASDAWRAAAVESGLADLQPTLTDVSMSYGQFIEAARREEIGG
jgi:hypothetical protein